MASLRPSDRLLRYSRFSLRSLLVGLTLASLAFAGWWQRPVQIDHMPPELVKVSGDGCLHSIIQTALWLEVSPPPTDRLEALLLTSQNNGTYVFGVSGKCWARRRGLSDWLLDGTAEVFTSDNTRVICAEYSHGKLHGEFRSWYTTGQLREMGRYMRGEKDGVWEIFEQHTNKVASHEEYDRGKKVGVWTGERGQEYFHDGKLYRRELASRYTGEWTSEDFDAEEKLQRVSFWNMDQTQQLGVDHYVAGRRHGSWNRVRMVKDRRLVHRGQWTAGLPSGEWVYERQNAPPQRLKFQEGALVAIDDEQVCDVLLQRLSSEETQWLREALLAPSNHAFPSHERKALCDSLYEIRWRRPFVDPQLTHTSAEFAAVWQEFLPGDFDYDQLPRSAAFCLGLRSANLTLDYRFGTFWITTPQLAASWRDETGAAPWFQEIVATPFQWSTEAGRRSQLVDSPYVRRDRHFGVDWEAKWQAGRKLEFATPLTCSLGTARRIDGSNTPVRPRLQILPEMIRYHDVYGTSHSFDEFITLECEANHCHLVLRGDTLYLEPR